MDKYYSDFFDRRSSQKTRELINYLIVNAISLFPKSTYEDFHKLFYQGFWGPRHFFVSAETASNSIQQEIDSAFLTEDVSLQPVGLRTPMLRVSLSLVKEGIISVEQLVQLFYESVASVNTASVELKEYSVIFLDELSEIKKNNPVFNFIIPEKIDFSENNHPHHSEMYNNLYNPHYRIIVMDKILPLLPFELVEHCKICSLDYYNRLIKISPEGY
ncbi:MAG: hypothetical protein PHR06_06300 [Candidatus Cloacimonetes bacterium]|nr:hypothetical protein [Candidatus Cloacimonadota bacterium]